MLVADMFQTDFTTVRIGNLDTEIKFSENVWIDKGHKFLGRGTGLDPLYQFEQF